MKRKRLSPLKILFLILYLTAVSLFLYYNKYGLKTYFRLEKKTKELQILKTGLELKKNNLKRELELQNASSPFFIEMVAREKLRMSKPGEVIYFIDTKAENGKNK